MLTQFEIRNKFVRKVDRILETAAKLRQHGGKGRAFSFPDAQLLSEGLLLAAWTQWEEMIKDLFLRDLARREGSVVLKNVKSDGFRHKGSALRLAEAVAANPDGHRHVEWNNIEELRKRADCLLGEDHRFDRLREGVKVAVVHVKIARDAIAHGSDNAWQKFIKMISDTPFALSASQRKGITVGRLLSAHKVGSRWALDYFLRELRRAAFTLVPRKVVIRVIRRRP